MKRKIDLELIQVNHFVRHNLVMNNFFWVQILSIVDQKADSKQNYFLFYGY